MGSYQTYINFARDIVRHREFAVVEEKTKDYWRFELRSGGSYVNVPPLTAGMVFAELGLNTDLIAVGLRNAALQLQLESMFPQLEHNVGPDRIVFVIDPMTQEYWRTVKHLLPVWSLTGWEDYKIGFFGCVEYMAYLNQYALGALLWNTRSSTC
jgi:hypothetical protein